MRKVLFYDGVYTLTGRIVRTALALALGILVARALGPYQRGLYALPTALYTGLIAAVFTGISLSVSYFMLTAGAGRTILRPALITCAIFSVSGAIPAAAAAVYGHHAWAALPSVLILPCNALTMLLLGYAVGTKRIRWQTTYFLASTGALLAGMAVALWAAGATAVVAVTAYVVVNALVAAVCLYIVIHDARKREGLPISVRAFAYYALRTGFVSLVTVLNYRADLYVVALLTTTAALGQYAVAISAAEGLLVVTQVGAIVTSPHVGGMERREAARLTAKCVRATLLMTIPICAAFYAIAPLLVQILYGGAYLPLVPALRILLIAVLILSVGSPISNFFTLNRGKPEIALTSAVLGALVCMGVSWLLVPRVGMAGAALATAVAYFFGESVRMRFFIAESGIPLREILLPNGSDVESYVSMARSLRHDAGRLLSQGKRSASQR